tara:strand:- start:151 stop:1434 length:1284 start_codon:yes stop_codon:yes gene_type:complete
MAMPAVPNPDQRGKVLLDAANIISASPESNADGRLLISAFEHYEKLGYEVQAIVGIKSYDYYMINEIPGFNGLRKLKMSKKLIRVSFDDDKHLLDLCVKEKAWLVTYDKFDDRTREGVTTKRQRSLYPELPWKEIDEFTRGTETESDGSIVSHRHWSVRGTDFYDPEMPKAPKRLFETKLSKLTEAIDELDLLLAKMDGIAEAYEDGDLSNKKDIRKRIAFMQGRAKGLRDVMPDAEIDESSLSGYTVVELKSIARDLGIAGRSNKKKDQLIQMIKDHIKPSPEKIKEDVKKKRAEKQQQAGIRATKWREERRPKPKDKYPKTARAAKKNPAKREKDSRAGAKKTDSKKPKGEMTTAQCGKVVLENLRKTPSQKRPRKKSTLLNHIKNQRTPSWSPKATDAHILNWLKQRGFISFEDNDAESVKYNI